MLVEDYADHFDEDGRVVMEEIIANSIKMGQLIVNLLEFSHIGKQNITIDDVNMGALVESVVKELRQQEPTRKIQISLKPLANIKGD